MNEIFELLQKHIDNVAPEWESLSLQQQVDRERRMDAQRKERQSQSFTDAIKQGSWTCQYCGQIVEPKIMATPYALRQVVRRKQHCDCDEGVKAFTEMLAAKEQEARCKYLSFLTGLPEWAEFDINWSNTIANSELKAAKELVLKCYTVKSSGLLLSGPVGSGKSHLARCFHKAHGVQGKAVYFITEPDIVGTLGNDYHQTEIVTKCKRADVLILDDIGAETFADNSEWVKNKLQSVYFRILERRKEKITFITTNLKGKDFLDHVGVRTSSRIMEVIGGKNNTALMFNVPDHRVSNV